MPRRKLDPPSTDRVSAPTRPILDHAARVQRDKARLRDSGKVDRLSKLPVEMLTIIFDYVHDARRDRKQFSYSYSPELCLISRALLPVGRSRLYKEFSTHDQKQLRLFVRTILERAELGQLVRRMGLSASVGFDPGEGSKFWLSLTGVQIIDVHCVHLINELLSVDPTGREGALSNLTHVDFGLDRQTMLNPSRWMNLLKIAPNIEHFGLSKGMFANYADLETLGPPGACAVVGLEEALSRIKSFEFNFNVIEDRTRLIEIIHFMTELNTLHLTSESCSYQPSDLHSVFSRLRSPKICHLILRTNPVGPGTLTKPSWTTWFPQLRSLDIELDADFDELTTNLPPSLECLRLKLHPVPSLADVRALLVPGRHQLVGLKKLHIDPLKLRSSSYERVKIIQNRTLVLTEDRQRKGTPHFAPNGNWPRSNIPQGWTLDAMRALIQTAAQSGVILTGLESPIKYEEEYLNEVTVSARLKAEYERGTMAKWITPEKWTEREKRRVNREAKIKRDQIAKEKELARYQW